jgi:hypothetical protein
MMKDRGDVFGAFLAIGLISAGVAETFGGFCLCYLGGALLLAVLTDPPSKWRKSDG